MKRNNYLVIGVLVLITIFSISFRFESIFSEEVFDYEWHTSTVLRHLQIWEQKGGLSEHFVPGVTYSGASNAHINNHSSIEEGRLGYADADGNYYYVSYPPFAYIAPYLLFKVSGSEVNIVGLRVFNLFVQILTAGVIFLLLRKITKDLFTALLGYTLYIFLAISLYVHTVNYMSDMFVQAFFALAGLLFYLIVKKAEESPTQNLNLEYAALCITLVGMVYTEWLGIFVCAFLFAYGLLHRKRPYAVPLLLMSSVIPLCVGLIVVLQYASISNLEAFISVMTDRYAHGYVPTTDYSLGHQVWAITQNYLKWFGAPIAAIAIFLAVIKIAELKAVPSLNAFSLRKTLSIIGFFAIPILLHHIIFLDWTAFEIHFYSVLKSAVFVSVLIPLLVYKAKAFHFAKFHRLMHIFLMGVLVMVFGSSMLIYVHELSSRIKGDSTEYCILGENIKARTADDEVVFLQPVTMERFNNIISSVVILCAERNVALYTSEKDASALMHKNGTNKGVLFTIDYNGGMIEFVKSERITASEPSTGTP